MKEILFNFSSKLMVYNAGLLQINKQTAMNVHFIKNLKKGRKKNLNSGSLHYPDIGLRNSAALVI